MTCPRGTFRRGQACILCPKGTYSDSENQSSCTKCAAGTYYPYRGAKTVEQCISCLPDTYSAKRGSTSCKRCPPGTNSLASSQRCYRCRAGTGLRANRNGCSACAARTYNDGSSNFCQHCPDGRQVEMGLRGQTKCTLCPRGTYFDSLDLRRLRCIPCPGGTYADVEGLGECKLCPLGTMSKPGSESCRICPKNTFRNKLYRRSCERCPMFSTSVAGSAGCKHAKEGCAFDTFEDRAGVCRACLPGEYLDVREKKCKRCADDEVSRGGAVTECTKCDGNSEPALGPVRYARSECNCKRGYGRALDGSCKICPAGTASRLFRTTIAWPKNINVERYQYYCDVCKENTYSDRPGSTECLACPPHTEALFLGAKKCVPCQGGEATLGDGSCKTLQYSCTFGEIRDKNGECKAKNCMLPLRKTSSNVCGYCDYYTQWSLEKKECVDCPRWLTNVQVPHTNTSCISCPDNSYPQIDGECVCTEEYTKTSTGECEKCPPNTIASGEFRFDGIINEDESCKPCAEGYITQSNGGWELDRCSYCREDSYLPEGASRCVACPSGSERMYNVAGNPVNRCAPIDPFGEV